MHFCEIHGRVQGGMQFGMLFNVLLEVLVTAWPSAVSRLEHNRQNVGVYGGVILPHVLLLGGFPFSTIQQVAFRPVSLVCELSNS